MIIYSVNKETHKNTRKSPGEDNFDLRILHLSDPLIMASLAHVFNSTFALNYVPVWRKRMSFSYSSQVLEMVQQLLQLLLWKKQHCAALFVDLSQAV